MIGEYVKTSLSMRMPNFKKGLACPAPEKKIYKIFPQT